MKRTHLPLFVSLDSILLAVVVGASISGRYFLELPQLIPNSRFVTAGVVLLVAIYWGVDLCQSAELLREQFVQRVKLVLLSVPIAVMVIVPTVMAVWLRHVGEPYQYVHDGLIQSEVAVDFVLEGKNPYAENYLGTAMESWPYQEGELDQNPALFFYPYLPATFILPMPFDLVGTKILGWFDHRIVYLGLYVGLLGVIQTLARRGWGRPAMIIGVGLNPLLVPFVIEGRNDIITLTLIAVSFLFLRREHLILASISFALACATKQIAWFLLPAFAMYLGSKGGGGFELRRLRGPAGAFTFVLVATVLPWFAASPARFLTSTIGFQSGASQGGYPISGFGLGTILLSLGLITGTQASFPFLVVQMVTALLGSVLTWKLQARFNSLQTALTTYGFLLFVVAFTSRALHDSHFGFVVCVLTMAALMGKDDHP